MEFATKDELNDLTGIVRGILNNVTILDTSVGLLDSLVERINHLSDLKDVTITYITEGDLLLYSSDGTWHNIQPSALGIGGEGTGGIVDTAVVKAMIKSEGSKLFLSKLQDDIAAGIITFNKSINVIDNAYLKKDLLIGKFVSGMIGGTGAKIDKDGRGEMTSLILREFLEVPELRFNKIDIVSGELWNSIAFGTIEAVDIKNLIVTVKLEEGEYSGIKVNDICRGIFHNLKGTNDTESKKDSSGFDTVAGFSTAYFTPIEVLDSFGKRFRYSLKPDTTLHPSKSMKFVVYGNFTDKTRQSSAYATRTYKRYLKDVNTWGINYTHIASQFGLLDGLNIPGAPNEGNLEGDGAYLTNVYMTGSIIQFTPEQLEDLKGDDAYQVSLDRETATVIVDNDMNIIEEYNQTGTLTFAIQAWKGKKELVYSDVYNKGSYFIDYTPVGVKCTMLNGVFKITEITNINEMRIDININCEGISTFKRKFWLNYLLEGNSLWVTYNDNDALPDRPTADGTAYGWHRNYTSTAIWMSTKNSRRIDEGEWGDPVRFVGASVQGQDGQYTVFCYTNSSVKPNTPSKSLIPPSDETTTWYMYPPKRESVEVFTWMTQATVYADKSLSGWTEPIKITGETGEDGADGGKSEFIYTLFTPTTDKKRPDTPATSQLDDFIPYGWTDSPQGVSKTNMYEWVCTREKKAAKIGEGVWGDFTTPVVWSKWGEKGMDGDGYEYIFARTSDIDKVPMTPESIQLNDYVPTIANGGSKDYNWSDDPKGVNETFKAEWTCKRVRTDNVWSAFSSPSLWSNWGEQGLSGGHYQYRWKISATKPAIPTDAAASGWSTDSEIVPGIGLYVWLILRFSNPDGTITAWSNLLRLTGNDGKDGEDGNSIEFIYTRNAEGNQPATPTSVNEAGNIPSGWTDHPLGVTASLAYEWASQRYLDKATLRWQEWSAPGLWARYAERGKDGDGYEYIFRRFANFVNGSDVAEGGIYYPPADVNSAAYQTDDYVPSGWTDNGVGPTKEIRYEYVWTRKKENSKWLKWKNGSMWANYSLDGEQGPSGDPGSPGSPGQPGYSYTIDPGSFNLRVTQTGTYQPGSATFKCYLSWKDSAGGNHNEAAYLYWECWANNTGNPGPGNGTEVAYSSSSNYLTVNFSSNKYTYYWIGVSTTAYPDSTGDPVVASLSFLTVLDGADGSSANAEYVISRYRGYYQSGVSYFYSPVSVAEPKNYTSYPNYDKCRIRDFVQYQGYTYFVTSFSNSGFYSLTPSSSSSYWTRASYQEILTVNTLLADNAKLGEFNFSGTKFLTSNGSLSMDSSSGEFYCNKATIRGDITATSGTFTGTVYANDGTFTGTVNASAGTIGGFKISSGQLTNEGFNNNASIIFRHDVTNKFAGIGGYVFGALNSSGIVARFENKDTTKGLVYSNNTTMALITSGAETNHAITLDGGCIVGLAYKTAIIGYGSSNSTSDYWETLSRGVNAIYVTTLYTYTAVNPAVTSARNVGITLPDMRYLDDGYTIKIKRGWNNNKQVWIQPGNGQYREGTYLYSDRTAIMYDANSAATYYSTLAIEGESDAMELVYFRDLRLTVNGTTYKGGTWVQFKNPRNW